VQTPLRKWLFGRLEEEDNIKLDFSETGSEVGRLMEVAKDCVQ